MALVKTLKGTTQDFTASWVDYGPEVSTDGFDCMSIWLNIAINDTQNARLRILSKHTSGGNEYVHSIEAITASVVNTEDEYFEFTTDEDAKRVIEVILDVVIPYVQVQIQAGTVGATAGRILASKYILQ